MVKKYTTVSGILLCLAAVLVAFFPAQAGAQSLSNVPGSYADIGYGSRASGLGFAYTGMAEGSDAIMWNPAGMAQSDKLDFSMMYTRQYDLVSYNYVSASIPFKGQYLGLAIVSSGDEVLREHSLHAAYALSFGALKVGGVLKVRLNSFGNNTLNESDYVVFDQGEINEGFDRQIQGTGKGIGIDIGLLYEVSERIQFGLRAKDLYAPFNWDSETRGDTEEQARGSYSEDIPMEMAAGVVYRFEDHFILTTDFIPNFSESVKHGILRAGIEKKFMDVLYLRGGTEQNLRSESMDHYMAGFGVEIPQISKLMNIMTNYTYVINDFKNSHRIGIQFKF